LGIGIAAGSASRLIAGDTTFDYTGRPLNVASRLMDIARPAGVVLEETLDFEALSDETQELFARDQVFLKVSQRLMESTFGIR
jgi:class 3 adenylate cyclase